MKPVLLWPMASSAIAVNLDEPPDYFTVVDTTDPAAFVALGTVTATTLVLDPFPDHGGQHCAVAEHLRATGCRHRVAGLAPCQDVVRALKDPSLARASTEELLLALGYLPEKA